MEIDINKEAFSIGDKYRIYLVGKQKYSASAKLFRIFNELYVYEQGNDRLACHIKRKTLFRVTYEITMGNRNVYRFWTKKFWKGHFCCRVGHDLYEVFAHKGRKHSVYKNDTQIAWWDKQAVSWFNGDNYKITADNGSDYELIISFCLIIDSFFSSGGKKSAVNIDIGRLWLQAKEFDTAWKPGGRRDGRLLRNYPSR